MRSSHNKTRRPVENFLETVQKRKRTALRLNCVLHSVSSEDAYFRTQDQSISLGTTEVLKCLLTNSHSQPFSQKTLPMHVTWDKLVRKQAASYPFGHFYTVRQRGGYKMCRFCLQVLFISLGNVTVGDVDSERL